MLRGSKLGVWKRRLNTAEKSAKGIVGRAAPTEGPNDGRRRPQVKSSGSASDNRFVPAAVDPRMNPPLENSDVPESISNSALLDEVLERTNLQRALKRVRQNKGAPGIDGMSVDELPDYLRHHWLEIRAQLVAGSYRPQPVRRVEIPKTMATA